MTFTVLQKCTNLPNVLSILENYRRAWDPNGPEMKHSQSGKSLSG